MELKIFRDTLPQGGAGCTVKAELPLETEIRIWIPRCAARMTYSWWASWSSALSARWCCSGSCSRAGLP